MQSDWNERHVGQLTLSTSCGVHRLVLRISKPPRWPRICGFATSTIAESDGVGVSETTTTPLPPPGDLVLQPFYAFKPITGVLQQTARKWPQESGDLCLLHQLSISLKCKGISKPSQPQENKDLFFFFCLSWLFLWPFTICDSKPDSHRFPFFNTNKWTKVCEMCSRCKTSHRVLQEKCASSCWLSHCHWNHHI